MGSEEPTVEIPSSILNGLLSRLEANAREAGEKAAFMQCMQEDQRVSQGKLDQLEGRLSRLEEEAATVDYSDQFREILESIQEDVEEFREDVEEWDELQGQEIELIQEEIKKLAGKHNSLVDNTSDSVQELYERIADLEEAVADVVEDSGSDSEADEDELLDVEEIDAPDEIDEEDVQLKHAEEAEQEFYTEEEVKELSYAQRRKIMHRKAEPGETYGVQDICELVTGDSVESGDAVYNFLIHPFTGSEKFVKVERGEYRFEPDELGEEVEDSGEKDSVGEPSEKQESGDDGVQCPQCGEEFESIDSLPGHTASLEDHVTIGEFFKNNVGVFECVFCESFETRQYQSFVNHVAGHGITLTELYLAEYEDLAEDTRVDEDGFNANGNIPELHQTKKIEEYSQSKLIEISEDFLDSKDRAYRLKKVASDRFDQELDTQSSEVQKLRNAFQESDRIESRNDPYDGRRNAYYTGDSKQVVAP